MLFVYGSLMPLRLLEEIRFWKTQEKEHTSVIRQIVPGLEAEYMQLLHDWEDVFAKTEALTQERLEAVIRSRESVSPELQAKVDQLLHASIHQSDQFVRHLFFMINQSQAVQDHPSARVVLLHILRESKYFLGILESMKWSQSPDNPDPNTEARPPNSHPQSQITEQPDPIRTSPHSQRRTKNTTHRHVPDSSHPTTEPQQLLSESIKLSEETRPRNDIPPNGLTATTEGTWTVPIDSEVQPLPVGKHQLPPLPYRYDALEPYIDETTVRIHYHSHHRGHLDGWNHAEEKLSQARHSGEYDRIAYWQRAAAYHESAHHLHMLYWNSMSAKGAGKPFGPLARQLERDLDGFHRFKLQFTHMANQAEDGGWTILVWRPTTGRLDLLQSRHSLHHPQWDMVPLLALDLWEHAYYLKYQNHRARYIDAWWHLVDWKPIGERYERARSEK